MSDYSIHSENSQRMSSSFTSTPLEAQEKSGKLEGRKISLGNILSSIKEKITHLRRNMVMKEIGDTKMTGLKNKLEEQVKLKEEKANNFILLLKEKFESNPEKYTKEVLKAQIDKYVAKENVGVIKAETKIAEFYKNFVWLKTHPTKEDTKMDANDLSQLKWASKSYTKEAKTLPKEFKDQREVRANELMEKYFQLNTPSF